MADTKPQGLIAHKPLKGGLRGQDPVTCEVGGGIVPGGQDAIVGSQTNRQLLVAGSQTLPKEQLGAAGSQGQLA
ncbi:MAG TPA: hypothetical protein VJ179_01530 [Patescibacteria group bacterium]|nr:hypothetical protein [Patescibacteria group bacterium]